MPINPEVDAWFADYEHPVKDAMERVRSIIDRGPFVKGRIIDLSRAAARQLEMIGPGVAPVEIRVVDGGPSRHGSSDYWVQAGAFRDAAEAKAFLRNLRRDFANARLTSADGWHRVRLGPYAKRKKAQRTQRELENRGIDAYLLQL